MTMEVEYEMYSCEKKYFSNNKDYYDYLIWNRKQEKKQKMFNAFLKSISNCKFVSNPKNVKQNVLFYSLLLENIFPRKKERYSAFLSFVRICISDSKTEPSVLLSNARKYLFWVKENIRYLFFFILNLRSLI